MIKNKTETNNKSENRLHNNNADSLPKIINTNQKNHEDVLKIDQKNKSKESSR